MTLREGNREYFYSKLDEHFPGLKEKYIKTYGNSYEVTSLHSKELNRYLIDECNRRNIVCDNNKVFEFLRTYPKKYEQLSIFDI